MAEPQNLRFRQFQAFFGCKGKKSNKNKDKGQFFRLFLIISLTKKNWKSDHFWIFMDFRSKKGQIQKDFSKFPKFNTFPGTYQP